MKKKLLNELKLKAMNDEAEASASLASHNYHYGVHETVAFKEGQESERTQIMEWAKETHGIVQIDFRPKML